MPRSKEAFVRRLFDALCARYDLFNRLSSFGLDRGWRRRAVAGLGLQKGGERVLDVAGGTGDLAAEAAVRVLPLGSVTVFDLSYPMLKRAQVNLKRHPVAGWHALFAQGRAEALPFRDGRFDAVTMGFALRNLSDLEAAFAEFFRVLAPGGRAVFLEFGRPALLPLRWGFRLWLWTGIPLIGLLTTGRLWPFLYLRRSIRAFPGPGEVLRRLRAAGFLEPRARPLSGGIVHLYEAAKPPVA